MNLSTSFKIKLKESKANITDIKEEEDESDEIPAPTQRKSSTKYIRRRNSSKIKQQIKLVESENELDDDLNSSSESPSLNRRPRVDRFLSIVEIPPEVVWLSQQKFAKQFAMPDIEETANDEIKPTAIEAEPEVKKIEALKKKTNKKAKKIDNKGKNGLRSNLNGSTLSQETKARIIKDIIRNYDIDYFMDELRAKDTVQIQLNKNDANARPIRNRIMKLMKSDVIRINDGDYMRELSKRIQKTYEEKQDKLMQNLEERERKRERKLKLKGLLAKTSEEEENERKTRFNSESFQAASNKLSLRKNSNLLDPIVNSSSAASINCTTSLVLGKLPKLFQK